jgi:hypothetical protein
MYIRNRKGPTDPWGTPASIPSHPDENLSKTTGHKTGLLNLILIKLNQFYLLDEI